MKSSPQATTVLGVYQLPETVLPMIDAVAPEATSTPF
jgi:hypothetical protein